MSDNDKPFGGEEALALARQGKDAWNEWAEEHLVMVTVYLSLTLIPSFHGPIYQRYYSSLALWCQPFAEPSKTDIVNNDDYRADLNRLQPVTAGCGCAN